MWTLVRKDLILDRRMVGLSLATYLVMGPLFMVLPSEVPVKMIAGWAGLVGAMVPLSLVGREDKFGTAALTCSLPVTRNQVVAARYVGGWLLSLGGALAILTTCYGVALLGSGHPVGAWSRSFLVIFVMIGLILAGLIPFTMRFGLVGLVVFGVAMQLLGIVAFLGVVLFGGVGTIRRVIGGIAGALSALEVSIGSFASYLALVVAIILLNVASFGLSRWIHRRREL